MHRHPLPSTGALRRRLGRVAWAVAALVAVLQVVAGLAEGGLGPCHCPSAAVAPPPACCPLPAAASAAAPTAAQDCTGCRIAPAEAAGVGAVAAVPAAAAAAVRPAAGTVIVWPPARASPGRPCGDPPDPAIRRLRTVVLTC